MGVCVEWMRQVNIEDLVVAERPMTTDWFDLWEQATPPPSPTTKPCTSVGTFGWVVVPWGWGGGGALLGSKPACLFCQHPPLAIHPHPILAKFIFFLYCIFFLFHPVSYMSHFRKF